VAVSLRLLAPVFLAWLVAVGCSSQQDQSAPALTPEAKAYVRNLQLGDVTMKATDSYAQQTVTEIEGKITNAGDRTIQRAQVSCVFYNRFGEVIKRERVPLIKTTLKPGESRSFRLPFDDLPASWNNQMPQLVIASIEFS